METLQQDTKQRLITIVHTALKSLPYAIETIPEQTSYNKELFAGKIHSCLVNITLIHSYKPLFKEYLSQNSLSLDPSIRSAFKEVCLLFDNGSFLINHQSFLNPETINSVEEAIYGSEQLQEDLNLLRKRLIGLRERL